MVNLSIYNWNDFCQREIKRRLTQQSTNGTSICEVKIRGLQDVNIRQIIVNPAARWTIRHVLMLLRLKQCRSKGNITGGARERRRREPLGGSGGMLPQKILKARGLKMLFPAFSKSDMWFMHIANYLLRTLSQQTNVHWEYNTCNVNY